jgi:type IV secretion system protein TrbL
MINNFQKLAIFLFFLFSFNFTYSQSCDSANGTCLNSSLEIDKTKNLALNATNQLKLAINSVEEQIDSLRNRHPFKVLGRQLIVSLFLIVFMWAVIKNMLVKPVVNQIFIDLIYPCIILGLIFTVLDQNLGQIIADSVQYVTVLLTSNVQSNGTSSEIYAENLLKSMLVIWSAPNTIDPFNLGIEAAISFLLKIVSIFFIGSSIAVGLTYLLIAKFQIALAIALGPIMIPWVIWKPTEFIFTSWLNFLLKSSFVSLCVFSIESILRVSIVNLVNLSDSVTQGVNSAFVYGTVSLLSLLFSLLISKSYDIGNGLISGVSSGFSKVIPQFK